MAVSAVGVTCLLKAMHLALLAAPPGGTDPRASGVARALETTMLLEDAGIQDMPALVAPLLCEAVARRSPSASRLAHEFGCDVERLVFELADDPDVPLDRQRQRRLTAAQTLTPTARLVRLADTATSLAHFPGCSSVEDCEDYIRWAIKIAHIVRGQHRALDLRFAQAVDAARDALLNRPPQDADETKSNGNSSQDLGLKAEIRKLEKLVHELKTLRARTPRVTDDKDLQQEATQGVWSLAFAPTAKGETLSINGAMPRPVPEVLAALLRVIAFPDAIDAEGFPHFISLDGAADAMTSRLGRPYTPKLVTATIHRLRRWLKKTFGVNPLYVGTCPDRGVRFRLRRQR